MTTPAHSTPQPVIWVGVAEYAKRRNLSKRTVYARLALGQIPGAEQPAPGCSWRIPVAY